MANEVACDVCGKHFKSGAGLAGHTMLVHPKAKEELQISTEEAVLELLGSLKEVLERFETKFEPLAGQLETVDERLTGFQASMVDRIKIAEEARDRASAELRRWKRGDQHITLRSFWDVITESCPDCIKTKQAIVEELKERSKAATTEPEVVAEAVPAPSMSGEPITYVEKEIGGVIWHVPAVDSEASTEASEAPEEEIIVAEEIIEEPSAEAETSGATTSEPKYGSRSKYLTPDTERK